MVDCLKKQIFNLAKKSYLDKQVVARFLTRIKKDKRLTKEENPTNHFCCFFLPFDKRSRSIYLVDHIKAQDWIPPGGHIKRNELPLETVKREFSEELNYQLTKEKIEFFNLSIKRINKPNQVCKIHYDLWYLVYINRISFVFTKKEFYQAGWFSAEKGLQLIKTTSFNTIVKKLINLKK